MKVLSNYSCIVLNVYICVPYHYVSMYIRFSVSDGLTRTLHWWWHVMELPQSTLSILGEMEWPSCATSMKSLKIQLRNHAFTQTLNQLEISGQRQLSGSSVRGTWEQFVFAINIYCCLITSKCNIITCIYCYFIITGIGHLWNLYLCSSLTAESSVLLSQANEIHLLYQMSEY